MSETQQVYIDQDNPHLGGYIMGGDEATYYPEMWKWLYDVVGIRSVLDIGCGEGHALDYFQGLGCEVMGVDGVKQPARYIYQCDFTRKGWPCNAKFDLIWCCEFLEHIPERALTNVLPNFQCAPVVLLTHAMPGQLGYHHVNLQPSPYWEGVMAAIGYEKDWQLTAATRMWASKNENEHNHYVRSGMAFRRVEK